MAQSTKSLVKKLIKMYTSGTMYNPCHYIHRHYGLTRLQSESFFFSDIDNNCTYVKQNKQTKKSVFPEQQQFGVSFMFSFPFRTRNGITFSFSFQV